MVGPTDAQMPPELPEITGISVTNSQSRMIYSWKVNELSSHHPADSIMDDLHKSQAGINKALALARMCLLAQDGSRCDRLYQEVPDVYWVQ